MGLIGCCYLCNEAGGSPWVPCERCASLWSWRLSGQVPWVVLQALMPASTVWLDEVYMLVEQQKPRAALDVLFERVDDLVSSGEFCSCNAVLEKLNVHRLDTNLLVGVLSITKRAAAHLPERPFLVERIRVRLSYLAPGRVDRLLACLES